MLNPDPPLWGSGWEAPGREVHLWGHLVAVLLEDHSPTALLLTVQEVQDENQTKIFSVQGLIGLCHVDN